MTSDQLEPSKSQFTLTQQTIVRVKPSDDRFRKLTFKGEGIRISYLANASFEEDEKLRKEQEWPTEDDDPAQPGALVMLKGGGDLHLTCLGQSACSFTLSQ